MAELPSPPQRRFRVLRIEFKGYRVRTPMGARGFRTTFPLKSVSRAILG